MLEKKRLNLRQELHLWFAESARNLQLKEAPFTWEVAQELRIAILGHGDPAEGFLVATARAYDMTLVTTDEKFLQARDLKILPNN